MNADAYSDNMDPDNKSVRQEIKPCLGFVFDEVDERCIKKAIRNSEKFMSNFGKSRGYIPMIDKRYYAN